MKETFYFNRNTALINYTKKYCTTPDELISSEGFSAFLDLFFDHIQKTNSNMYDWLMNSAPFNVSSFELRNVIKQELMRLLKILLVLEVEEIHHPYLVDRGRFLDLIEAAYQFWRKMERYSIVFSLHSEGYQMANFIEADTEYNALCLNFYRTIQQKVQGSKNQVYRQLQAGTNASLLLKEYEWDVPEGYEKLANIPFVHQIMLRTPLIIHPKHNKRHGLYSEHTHNPMEDFVADRNEWICLPVKVGGLLMFAYFHRDFMSGAVATPNLFEMASAEECTGHKPDAIMLFGNPDGTKDTVFWHDEENNIWIGKVSADERIDYFGYVKKMMLTLHNLAVMEKGWLPIHGAMVKFYLKDGTQKSLMFMGDSGAGKSETIEALSVISKDVIDHQEVIFDDMGSIHIDEDGNLVAQGTEIGAFVRLDDLDKGTAYKDMDRSIFFNPESANARVVVPAASYDVVVTNQKIDCFMYANNYTDARGMRQFTTKEEAMPTFVEGKRFALGTTQEKGISTTFFANPFGPMQKQEKCSKIIEQVFDKLFEKNIFVGEIYTCLGLENKGDNGIEKAAECLLEFVQK
ncbi:MAG: hypothetical protein HUJ57_00175 [Erysipelotrichaceae bacterium]|nr:hypothetical protein [Erysipelotrichaceae bacterium]